MKPTISQLKKKADTLFSKIVREERGKCEAQGVFMKCGGALNAHHIFSRSHNNTRYDKDNIAVICWCHHLYWAHKEPGDFSDWIREHIGEEKYQEIRRKKNIIKQFSIQDLEEIIHNLTGKQP